MGTLLAALIKKTGIRQFFTGVTVELPAYLLPSFKVVEIESAKRFLDQGSPIVQPTLHPIRRTR
jgi:hypothetical protein